MSDDRRDPGEDGLRPPQLLREYVDRILGASAVPGEDLDDVAEELYGHLYERWRQAVESGADSETAAERAIEAFGRPQALGPEFTSAFHSRLYASTIGLLLPVGAPGAGDGVRGYVRAVVFLGLGVAANLLVVVLIAAFLSPLSALVAAAGCLYIAALCVLAIKALGRGQAWAVVFIRLTCIIGSLSTVLAGLLTYDPNIPVLAANVGIAAWIVTGVSVPPEENAAGSGLLRRSLIPGVVATTLIALALPFGALAMPDPTQTTSSDLSMTVFTRCPASGPWSVTVNLEWRRTDALGGRLLPIVNDQLGLSVGKNDGTAPAFPGDRLPPAYDSDVTGGDLVDTATGATIHGQLSPGNSWSMPAGFYPGNRRLSIDPSAMHAGTTYQTTFRMDGAEVDANAIWGGRDGRFRVRYEHLGRWALEAIGTCGNGPVTATPVAVR